MGFGGLKHEGDDTPAVQSHGSQLHAEAKDIGYQCSLFHTASRRCLF